MIWVYDDAIVQDLRNSFNTDSVDNPFVSIVSPDDIVTIAAQLQNDMISFPIIALVRSDNIEIDENLSNFSRKHDGVATVFDNKENNIYYEKCMPLKLSYDLVCLSTNTADIDEILRELLFKYTSQYFITIQVPYESKRNIRIGLRVDSEESINWQSTTSDYLQSGKLHSAQITLHVDGAVLLHYTPAKLKNLRTDVDIDNF